MATYREDQDRYNEDLKEYLITGELPEPDIPSAPTVSTISNSWTSEYTYNSLNQLTVQKIPDQGHDANGVFQKDPTLFWYDDLGRLVASQNPEQETRNDYSYTCLLYTSPSPRDRTRSRMPSSA